MESMAPASPGRRFAFGAVVCARSGAELKTGILGQRTKSDATAKIAMTPRMTITNVPQERFRPG